MKACPLLEGDARCGLMFLARGNQKFCMFKHTQKASFRAYLKRGGDVIRKRERKDRAVGTGRGNRSRTSRRARMLKPR